MQVTFIHSFVFLIRNKSYRRLVLVSRSKLLTVT